MMKKIICLILTLVCAFALFACDDVCEHKDEDKNGKCDLCEVTITSCAHKDEDADAVCDACGVSVTKCETCVDADNNGACDVCQMEFPCAACVDADKNSKCDVCGKAVECEKCADADKNGKCDVCNKDITCATCADADKNGKCDICGNAIVCKRCVDADGDFVCDVCGNKGDVFCTQHIDTNRNGVCEICGDTIDPTSDEAFFNIIETSAPTSIITQTIVKVDEDEIYNGSYSTNINGSDFDFTYNYEKLSDPTSDTPAESYKETVTGVVYYKDGRYSINGENWFDAPPKVAYMNMTFEINKTTIGEYKMSKDGKTLTATINSDDVKAIFGIEIAAEKIELTVKTNGTYLSSIALVYTTQNGSEAQINTSFTYSPVAA